MNITDYLNNINKESQIIFQETIKDDVAFGKAHHLSACIYEISELIADKNEREMLATVSAQLESGSINLALGFYRQAFSSLRLAFEMGLGVVYFSINKIEHFEWIKGKGDIKWSRLIDKENGVISARFANAFFEELKEEIESQNPTASIVYRKLSEFVHGNNETWLKSGIVIKLNKELVNQYFTLFSSVCEIILLILCCRYLKSFTEEQLDSLEFMPAELNYIDPIREYLGGPNQS